MFRYLLLILTADSMYQDQIGIYDWHKMNLGRPQDIYPVSQGHTLVVSTRSVMGLLNPSGELLWRRVISSIDSTSISSYSQTGIYTCSQSSVTMWSVLDGLVLWTKEHHHCLSILAVDHNSLNLVAVLSNEGISFLTSLEGNLVKMIKLEGPLKILNQVNDQVSVLLKDQIIVIKLRSWSVEHLNFPSDHVHTLKDSVVSLSKDKIFIFQDGKVSKFPWTFGRIEKSFDSYLVSQNNLIEITESGPSVKSESKPSLYCDNSLVWVSQGPKGLSFTSPSSPSTLIEDSAQLSNPVQCLTYKNAKGETLGFVINDDFSFLCFRDNKLKWRREEGLGHLTQLYFMELPTREMHSHNLYFASLRMHDSWADVFSNIALRLQSQLTTASVEVEPLERDNFGLKKLILAYSRAEYLFAIQSQDSHVYWRARIPGLVKVIQVSPEEAKVVSCAGGRSKVLTLSLADGRVLDEQAFEFETRQVSVRGEEEELSIFLVNLRAVLQVFGKAQDSFRFHNVVVQNGTVEGIDFHQDRQRVMWALNVPRSERIVSYSPNSVGKVHQPAIATGTSRLIYKYLDSNLFAIATQKSSDLYIYIINSVSGHIVYRLHQEGVKGKVTLAFHEHKLYAHYFNQKYERFEILTAELFKGEVEYSAAEILKKYYSHGFKTEYSSKWTPEVNVFSQTYIFNYPVRDMKVTRTLQGITKPMLLMILESGKVYMLDCTLLSPRRKYEDKSEEGLFDEPTLPKYKPFLPLNHVSQLTYFLELEGLEQVKTSFTALESTSIGAFFGLDLFVTRIMPEKSFDALTDDFNKEAIVLSVVALVVANIVAHRWFSLKTAKEKFNL